jgi:hypothetical protein
MGLGGPLPGAIADDIGLYSSKTLRLTVRPTRRALRGAVVTTGTYTPGKITLYPCTRCSVAFLTQVYLHELFHAWLHQFHPEVYHHHESCPVAEEFADKSFAVLGGRIRPRRLCGSYSLRMSVVEQRLRAFEAMWQKVQPRTAGRVAGTMRKGSLTPAFSRRRARGARGTAASELAPAAADADR